MSEYFTWDYLATYAGAILAVTLITELIKSWGFIKRIPTRLTAYVIALVVMILALVFTGAATLSSCVLTLINAAVVSLAANGTYDALQSKKGTASTNYAEFSGVNDASISTEPAEDPADPEADNTPAIESSVVQKPPDEENM